ncbi:N-acetyltransferase [Halobacteriovorax sp. GB3]|uniref:GNAT family N-acetyltransferase n=1 Tax=Halobacteriovorax sp. GB3 TaxID=2719615 RepID=UPI002360C7C0|nr:N-acetyltransferase [Halobacteriovorax sp. GB3]MDD0852022.1 N-acetyltransferase [Halobacteriovorax sp. GB3]
MKNINYTLRNAQQDDLSFVLNLHHTTLREYIEPLWGWDKEQWDKTVTNWFRPERIQIITTNEVDIGILVVQEKDNEFFFESISIQPEFQNKGIGKKVISNIVEKSDLNNKAISLHVLKTNSSAKRLYESYGFHQTGEDGANYTLKREPNC